MTTFSDLKGPVTSDIQNELTPQEAMVWLEEGHARFQSQSPRSRNHGQLLEGASKGQFPYAAVLGCIDSRAPIEHIFDAQIGDLFVARVAGNVINGDVLGSLEYACKYAVLLLLSSEAWEIKAWIIKKIANVTDSAIINLSIFFVLIIIFCSY